MSSIDDDNIHTRFDYRIDAIRGVRAGAYGCSYPQPALLIFTGIGIVFGLTDIFECNKTFENKVLIDNQNLFDAVAMQQLLYIV